MPTLDEIDEALQHCRAVPPDERGAPWHAYVDSLLAQRDTILRNRPAPKAPANTRVLFSSETR